MQYNKDLYNFNTFHLHAQASRWLEVNTTNDLQLLKNVPEKKYILGGGSNILLTGNIEGCVVKNNLKGLDVIDQNENHVWLKVAGGETWHDVVMHCVNNNWGGIENLSLIPGTAGAAPIQNIGAYGVEVKDVIEKVTFYNWEADSFTTFSNAECNFGYRDSVFKTQLKGQIIVTEIVLKLTICNHTLHTEYGAINTELLSMGITMPTIKDVSDSVIAIRKSKLPDPAIIGNAGSFFKNPEITNDHYQHLKNEYNQMPGYLLDNCHVKVPAGWLIEKAGWKGYRDENAGVHEKQALVLVNYQNASGSQILKLSDSIIQSIREKFEISLEREVQIWP